MTERPTEAGEDVAAQPTSKFVVTNSKKPYKPELLVRDVQDTPLGIEWERSNKQVNGSASARVKAAHAAEKQKKQAAHQKTWAEYS